MQTRLFTYLGFLKKLYSINNVKAKNARPSTAINKRFLVTTCHSNGDVTAYDWPEQEIPRREFKFLNPSNGNSRKMHISRLIYKKNKTLSVCGIPTEYQRGKMFYIFL